MTKVINKDKRYFVQRDVGPAMGRHLPVWETYTSTNFLWWAKYRARNMQAVGFLEYRVVDTRD